MQPSAETGSIDSENQQPSKGMIRRMCGRCVDKSLGPELQEHGRTLPERFRRLTVALDARPTNADVRPSQQVPIVVAGEDATPRMAQWWYVPPYAKDPVAFRKQFTTFNARLEGVAPSRTYAPSWNGGTRCLFPMGGYYEWQVVSQFEFLSAVRRARRAIKQERTSTESSRLRLNRSPPGGAAAGGRRRMACHHPARRGAGRVDTHR
jgi:hypothetical protein